MNNATWNGIAWNAAPWDGSAAVGTTVLHTVFASTAVQRGLDPDQSTGVAR